MPRCAMILSSLASMELRRSSSAALPPVSLLEAVRGVVGAEYEEAEAEEGAPADADNAPPLGRRKELPEEVPFAVAPLLLLLLDAPPA